MKYLLPLLLTLLFLPTHALAADWEIKNFSSDMILQEDGKVKIVETIQANFLTDKHGIFRDIPVIYEDATGHKTYTEIDIESVERDSQSETFEENSIGNYLELKIGKASTEITGPHEYRITYLATGVLRGFTDYDEFYWNITGDHWEVPIEQASGTVRLAKGEIVQHACYQGSLGSTEPCVVSNIQNTQTTFSANRPLTNGEGLTVAVAYPKNLIPLLTVAAPKTLTEILFTPTAIATWIITTLLAIAGVAYRVWKHGRDIFVDTVSGLTAKKTVVPEYEAPAKLRPAQIGVLIDERADTLDVTATIIDFANRGLLTVTEIPKPWLFGSTDYELARTKKAATGLHGYEEKLLTALFADGDTVRTSTLKNTFYTELAEVKNKLYQDVTDLKLFDGNPESVRGTHYGIAVLFLIAGALVGVGGLKIESGVVAAVGSGLFTTGILLLLTAWLMPRRTAYGRELYRQALGYEMFINTAERYRVRFEENKNLFNEIMPYAIVFGITKKFAQAMKEMGIRPDQPTWYTGTHTFNPVVFASDIDNFSSSLSSAIASTPSGSGSGGGGFSGGGFGGGGGGSW